MTRRLLGLVIVVFAIAVPRVGGAQDPTSDRIVYRAKQKDTLGLLAAEFYGDRNKAIFIMAANKLDRARPLKPGERLRIPVNRQVTTSPGDSFASLAATYLGDARRAPFLAEFNDMAGEEMLASGTAVSIPFTITHTAEGTESVASIAAVYFGNTKNAGMLRRYNFLEKDSIDKGDHLLVPVPNVRLQPSKMPALDAESKERRDRQRLAQERAANAVPAAREAMRLGDFARVKAALIEVAPDFDYLETERAVEVGLLIGSMHLAYGETSPALEAFKRVLERKPMHQLSRYHHSPKILVTWTEAGGAVEAEGTP
jgi:LysM repeat protein